MNNYPYNNYYPSYQPTHIGSYQPTHIGGYQPTHIGGYQHANVRSYQHPNVGSYQPTHVGSYQPRNAGYKPIQISGLPVSNPTFNPTFNPVSNPTSSFNPSTNPNPSPSFKSNIKPSDITQQNKNTMSSEKPNIGKNIHTSTPISSLSSDDDKEYVLWLRQKDKECKAKNREIMKRENMSKEVMKEDASVVLRNEKSGIMIERKLRSFDNLFDKETVDKIRSIKTMYKPINDNFIEHVRTKGSYTKPNTRYYDIDIEIFINLLEYFEISYNVQDIIALYENPGNNSENELLQNELFGISTDIQLCVRLNTNKQRKRNMLYIQICNCDSEVITSLSNLFEILNDVIVIPLYIGGRNDYNNHLQKVGVDIEAYLEDEGMHDEKFELYKVFLRILNNLPEEKSKKYFN